MPTAGVRSRRRRPPSRCTPTVSMSRIMPSRGLSPGVALAQAGLSRRRVYPSRYLVRPHAENGLVVARVPADRQKQLHRVGAHLAVAGLLRSHDAHSSRAATLPLDVAPGQVGRLAHPQPRVPHQADHGNIEGAPPAGARGAFQPAAPSPARSVGGLPDGEIAVQVQRERPWQGGGSPPAPALPARSGRRPLWIGTSKPASLWLRAIAAATTRRVEGLAPVPDLSSR